MKPSLGVVLVALGNQRVRTDLRLAGFGPKASLDEVCDVLSAGSASTRRRLRINALRALGAYINKRFKTIGECLPWLNLLHPRLCAWAVWVLARILVEDDGYMSPIHEQIFWAMRQEISGFAVIGMLDMKIPQDINRPLLERVVSIVGNDDDQDIEVMLRAFAEEAQRRARPRGGFLAKPMFSPFTMVQLVAEEMVNFPEWVAERPDPWPMPPPRSRRQ